MARANELRRGHKGSTRLRDRVCRLASLDWAAAEEVAGVIKDPWYACQAYAWCARCAPMPMSLVLVDRAFQAALLGKDRYQQLAATAWPLRALVELGMWDEAAERFGADSYLSVGDVRPPSSRAEAAFLVFQALAIAPREIALRAFHWLMGAVRPIEHWRQERIARDAIGMALTLGLIETNDISGLLQDDPKTDAFVKRFAHGKRRAPRMFFWSTDDVGI